MKTLLRFCRISAPWRREEGSITVEMAAIASFLTVAAVGLFQFGAMMHQSVQLQQAARAGVEYAMKFPSDVSGIEQAVTQAAHLDPTGLAISVAQFCECANGSAISCADTCAGSASPNVFVQVAVNQPALGLLGPSGLVPDYTVQASAVMRVR